MHYLLNYSFEYCSCIIALSLFMVFYILIILDTVSELLKQAKEQYLRYKNLVDFIHGVLIIVDGNLTITYVNKGILSYQVSDLQGKHLGGFPFYNKGKLNLLNENNTRERYKWKFEDKNGEIYWFVVDASIQDSTSSLNGNEIALLIQDISFEKKIEEQEKMNIESKSSLKAKNEFIASISHEIRNPLQVISYNTENLLTKNLTTDVKDIIKDIYNSTKFLTTIIGDILDYSKIEAGEMKILKSKFEILDIVENSISMNCQTCLQKGLKLNLNFDFNLQKYFYSDSSRILQIMNNFITNAVKYTKEGTLDIKVKKIISEKKEDLMYFECKDTGIGIPDHYLKNLFDPFVQIFEKKYSPSEFKGWGLGLPICKRLLDLMNGKFGVESEVAIGSTFWFTIPIESVQNNLTYREYYGNLNSICDEINIIHSDSNFIEEVKSLLEIIKIPKIEINSTNFEKERFVIVEEGLFNLIPLDIDKKKIIISESKTNKQQRMEKFKYLPYPILPSNLLNYFTKFQKKEEIIPKHKFDLNLRILLVDDNLLILKSLERLLQSLKMTNIQKAKDGKEAIDLINKNEEAFDLIFMDISMPILNGIEATEMIRNLKNEKKSQCIIIALTGNTLMKNKEEQSKEWKMNDIISKPVNKNELIEIFSIFEK